MLAHDHSDFPSDLATILYAANATLSIASSAGTQVVDIGTFLQLEMTGLVRKQRTTVVCISIFPFVFLSLGYHFDSDSVRYS